MSDCLYKGSKEMSTLSELFEQFVKGRIYPKNFTPKTVYIHLLARVT